MLAQEEVQGKFSRGAGGIPQLGTELHPAGGWGLAQGAPKTGRWGWRVAGDAGG